MKDIKLNQVFTIEKASRKRRWKIIESDYFDNACALVKDHPLLYSGTNYLNEDRKYTCGIGVSLDGMYERAYDHT